MNNKSTLLDELLNWVKNQKVFSIIIFIGIVVIGIGTFTNALNEIFNFLNGTVPKKLEITDIYLSNGEEGTKKLDFRVLNNTTKTITISRLRLYTISYKNLMEGEPVPYSFSPITATYEVDLSELNNEGDQLQIPIAHELKAKSSDRFVVVVGMKNLQRSDRLKWELKPELVTNLGVVSHPKLTIILP
jgi:hypothetical protein